MNIKEYAGVKIEFHKVPKECLIKTYLGSKVVIVSYGKYSSNTWDKHNTIKNTPNIYLEATTNEIKTAGDRFQSFVDKHRPKKPEKLVNKYNLEDVMENYMSTVTSWQPFIGD